MIIYPGEMLLVLDDDVSENEDILLVLSFDDRFGSNRTTVIRMNGCVQTGVVNEPWTGRYYFFCDGDDQRCKKISQAT